MTPLESASDTPVDLDAVAADLPDAPSGEVPAVLVMRLRGAVTRAELARACQELLNAGPGSRLLVDARGVDLPVNDDARVQLAAHLVVHFFDCRIALLARKEAIKGVTAGIASRAGIRMRHFWNEDSARAWLSGGP